MSNNVEIVCNPNKNPSLINNEKLLSDLGKCTKRGVKKCPNCGYLNGTRGYMCKNSLCNKIFKDSDKKKVQLDSLKLLTGTSRQIYSVCVRDKCPDTRGFVQLPLYEGGEKNLFSEVALCFVDTCQRLFDDSILKCHENEPANTTSLCVHIESALGSVAVATALEFKHDLISNLNVDDDVKKKLCLLAKSTDGPVVQKVSRNVMVVKCAVTPTNPLGYLHLMFCSSKCLESAEEIDTFSCDCTESLMQVKLCYGTKGDLGSKCLHYYASVCAFASDNRFTNRFSHFVHTEFDPMLLSGYELNLVNMLEIDIAQENILNKDTILEFSGAIDMGESPRDIQIEVLPSDYMFDGKTIEPDAVTPSAPKTKAKTRFRRKRVEVKRTKSKVNPAMNYFDVLSFNEWLPSVTERINSMVHYGTVVPEQLIFHIPNRFYELLKDRICFSTKRCQPDETKTVARHTPPLGQFMESSWRIKNVVQLKEIFDTISVSLKTLKYFAQNPDGTFFEYCRKEEGDSYMNEQMHPAAKFLVYIKVGNVDGEREDEPSFVVEWTRDLFKVSKFGELRLIFELGHRILET